MRQRAVGCSLILTVGMLLTGLACRRPNTVYGTVAVAPGVDEAVDGAVVAIYTRPDSLRIPYRTVRVVPAAPLAHRAHFRIGNLPLGDYWLRAWRDSNGDETLSDGDLAGILGGGSSRDSAGRAFWLGEGWVYDVGEIELERFEELVVGVSGRRYAGDTLTRFEYRFNHDVVLSSLAIRFPFYGEYPDGNAPGCKLADTVYTSPGWRFNGAVMPTDTHRLTFRGTRAGDTFRITVVVCVE